MSFKDYNYSPYFQQRKSYTDSDRHDPPEQRSDTTSFRPLFHYQNHGAPNGQYSQPTAGNGHSPYHPPQYGRAQNAQGSPQQMPQAADYSTIISNPANTANSMNTTRLGSLAYASALGSRPISGSHHPIVDQTSGAQHLIQRRGSPYTSGSLEVARERSTSQVDGRGSTTLQNSMGHSGRQTPQGSSRITEAVPQVQRKNQNARNYSGSSLVHSHGNNTTPARQNHENTEYDRFGVGSRGSANDRTRELSSVNMDGSDGSSAQDQRPAQAHPSQQCITRSPQAVTNGSRSPRLEQVNYSHYHQSTSSTPHRTGIEREVNKTHNLFHHLPPTIEGNVFKASPVQMSTVNANQQRPPDQDQATPRSYMIIPSHGTTHPAYGSRSDPRAQEDSGNQDRARGSPLSDTAQYPQTVDPNQVFNHFEFQRRNAAASAAKARDDALRRLAQAGTEQIQDRNSFNDSRSQNNTSSHTQTAHADRARLNATPPSTDRAHITRKNEARGSMTTIPKSQMENEMLLMLEKMREYKAKDPTLFSEIWEQVKKGQPQNRGSPQVAPAATESMEISRIDTTKLSELTNTSLTENTYLPSPSPLLNQRPIDSENPAEQLPDLGRFPFQRRRRGGRDGGSQTRRKSKAGEHVQPKAAPKSTVEIPLPLEETPKPPALASSDPVDPGAHAMREAMQTFHRASPLNTLRLGTNSDHLPTPQEQPASHGTTSKLIPGTSFAVAPGTQMYPPSSIGGTIWPEHKKESLSNTAQATLMNIPANADKTVTSLELRQLLDLNPSYTRLCEILEAKGFSFDRRHFALALLNDVPPNSAATVSPPNPKSSPTEMSPNRTQAQSRQLKAGGDSTAKCHATHSLDLLTSETSEQTSNSTFPLSQDPTRTSPFISGRRESTSSSNSPRRPRGRPRKDGLPQKRAKTADKQSLSETSRTNNQTDSSTPRLLPHQSSPRSSNNTRPMHSNTTHPASITQKPYHTKDLRNDEEIRTGASPLASTLDQQSLPHTAVTPDRYSKIQWSNDRNKTVDSRTFQSAPGLRSRYEPLRPLENHLDTSPSDPPTSEPAAVKVTVLKPDSNVQSALPEEPPPIPKPVHPTKREMALKQDFNDIVDLTKDLSDDDHSPDQQSAEALAESVSYADGHVRSRDNTLARDKTPSRDYSLPLPSSQHQDSDSQDNDVLRADSSHRSGAEMTTTTKHPAVDLSRFKAPMASSYARRDTVRSADIITPIDKGKALRRSHYNMMTVARDVLIATGKHPHEEMLNYHLESLEKNFRHVKKDSELSTFRWDLVDPSAEVQDANGKAELAVAEPDPQLVVPRQRVPTTQIPIGSDVEMLENIKPTQPLKRKRQSKQKVVASQESVTAPSRGSPSSVLSKLPNDRSGFSARPPRAHGQTFATYSSAASILDISRLATGQVSMVSSEQAGSSGMTETTHPRDNDPSRTIVQVVIPSPSKAEKRSGPPSSEPKRRGRLPGSQNVRRSGPVGTRPSRPSGLRHAISPSDGVAVMVESRSPSSANSVLVTQKRKTEYRDLKRMKTKSADTPRSSSRSYQTYQCGWKDCVAKLHNIATLRKHIRRLHSKRDLNGHIPCLWKNCCVSEDGSGSRGNAAVDEHAPLFKSDSENLWQEHVEKNHIEPLLWEFGDGPSPHPSDTEVSDYLSDSQGRQVTPLIRTEGGPPDPLPLPSDSKLRRVYHKAHGNVTQLEKAQALHHSIEANRRATGPNVMKGTSFVTFEMLETRPGPSGQRGRGEGTEDVPDEDD